MIAEGVPGTAMPSSGQTLSAADVDAVGAYVLTLAAPWDEQGTPEAIRPLLERAGLTPAASAKEAPDLDVLDAAGGPSSLQGRRGRLVLIVFWETGCIPCLAKLPQLERLATEFRDRGLEVMPVCVNEGGPESLRGVADRRLHSLPLYVDPHGSARLRYGVDAVPSACLVGRDGRVLGAGPGPHDWTGPEVRELLQACLVPEAAAGEGGAGR